MCASDKLKDPLSLNLCERGNTLLTNEENMIAWLDMGDGRFLGVEWTPASYPALRVSTFPIAEKATVEYINRCFQGWRVWKCNLTGVRITASGTVARHSRKETDAL